MGSSNLNCAVSNFPINNNERVVCIFLVEEYSDLKRPFHVYGEWKFASLPFEVKMGDYCFPHGLLECEGSGSGEIDTFNPIDSLIYEQFKKNNSWACQTN